MATGLIQQIQIDNGDLNNIASTVFGVCNTEANNNNKVVTINGFNLIEGTTIYVKFTNNNTASSPTLNVSGTGAKPLLLNNGESIGTNDETDGWSSGAILILTYENENWVRSSGHNTNDKVYQTISNVNNDFYILLKNSTNISDEIDQVHYSSSVSINPYSGILSATGFVGSGAGLTDISIDISAIPQNSITNNLLANDSITVAGRDWVLGSIIDRNTLLNDLKLSNAMHFIGVVASNSEHTPSDEQNGVPTISGFIGTYTPAPGDVVVDKDYSREYVYTAAYTWELLGQDASSVLDSNLFYYSSDANDEALVDANNPATPSFSSEDIWNNVWISRIQQLSDRTLILHKTKLDTSGTWTGNAQTASALETPRTIIVNLESTAAASFDGTANITLGTVGNLSVARGGTNNDTFIANRLVYTTVNTNQIFKLESTANIYASNNTITINGTSAPDNNSNFQVNGTSTMRTILPQSDNSYNLGNTDLRWANLFTSASIIVGTSTYTAQNSSSSAGLYMAPGEITISNITAAGGLFIYNNGTEYAHLSTSAIGTNSVTGEVELVLGNLLASPTENNARGRITLYSDNSKYSNIYADSWHSDGTIESFTLIGATPQTQGATAWTTLILGSGTEHSIGRIRIFASNQNTTEIRAQGNGNNTFYLPNYNDSMYAIHARDNNAVGSNTQPVFVNTNGRVTSLTYTPNKLYYSASSTSFKETNHYATENALAINDASTEYTLANPRPDYNFLVNGTSYFIDDVINVNTVYFAGGPIDVNDPGFYINESGEARLENLLIDSVFIDNDTISFNNFSTNPASINGTITVSSSTNMSFGLYGPNSVTANFDFNGNLIPSSDNNNNIHHNIGNFSARWGNLYLQGDLNMQAMGTPALRPATANKITWSGDGDEASIYYYVEGTNAGCLVLNTKNENCRIGFSQDNYIAAYIDTSASSFYPSANNTGSLGLSTNRWSKLYIGGDDTYGSKYQPIYWKNGAPDVAYPLQHFTWTIKSGQKQIAIKNKDNDEVFTSQTYVISLVVTDGVSNLRAPLQWGTYDETSDQYGCLVIGTENPVAGDVIGYAIVGYCHNIIIENDMLISNANISPIGGPIPIPRPASSDPSPTSDDPTP